MSINKFKSYVDSVEHFSNLKNFKSGPYTNQDILSIEGLINAQNEIKSWEGYDITPLYSLSNIAKQCSVGEIFYKDEGERFSLKSFKALGGAYAVSKLLIDELTIKGIKASSDDLISGIYKEITSSITVCSATDGNHGRSVAWGAQMFGCRCEIFIHCNVSVARENAIAQFGAKVHRVDGNYDDSVHEAAKVSLEKSYFVVSDTSYEGYTDVPINVMQGYTVMVDEAVKQMDVPATHVFLQGGVGGLAAAVVAYFVESEPVNPPTFIVVEPTRAGCLIESARNSTPTTIYGELETVMAGLSCGEVSLLAWKILHSRVNHFITIEDECVPKTMQLLANQNPPVISGESAVAGLAGLLICSQDETLRKELGIDEDSKVLCFGTEGDTDEDAYTAAVGRSAIELLGKNGAS
jgi:diaminopropionate ammonia-lyase